jgi:hypothetical protein
VTARIERSIVHTDGSNSTVYAINITSNARITLFLTQNVLKGGLRQLDVVGGAGAAAKGKPDLLGNLHNDGNTTVVHSRCNLFSGRGQMEDIGVILEGGFDARGFKGTLRPGSNRNSIHFHSVRDRIENVGTGLRANAAMRTDMTADPSSSNRVDIQLIGTTIRTLPPPSTATGLVPHDLDLCVARALEPLSTPVGDGNSIHALVQDVAGSGDRVYAIVRGSPHLGLNNTITFAGNGPAFTPVGP